MESLKQLALVTHELGGALAPTRNAIDLLCSGAAGEIGADANHLLQIAARGLARADRVLQNLRALVAPETYRSQTGAVEIAALLERVRAEFGTDAAARGVTLDVEADAALAIPSDLLCLEQVFVNLVGNAVKFTPRGGRVLLRVRPPAPAVLAGRLSLLAGGFGVDPCFVGIEVQDSGIGLSEEARRRLYEPFYRAPEARAAGAPGMGLGLTVARQLVGLLHGELRPLPPTGSGTTFVVTLPADAGTWELVRALDTALADLEARLEVASQALLVLRRSAGFGGAAPEDVAAALRMALGDERVALHALGAKTWLVVAPVAVRALLRASVTAFVQAGASRGLDSPPLVHARRVTRSAAADECVLQALVRCRHRLPVGGTRARGSSDAADLARR